MSNHEKLIGDVTKESSQIVANSLKTIFSRLGKDSVKNTLALEGIAIHGDEKDILDRLASKWNSFDDGKKQRLAQMIAGRFQAARLMILLDELTRGK